MKVCVGDSGLRWATDKKRWEEIYIGLKKVTFNMDDAIINTNYYSNSVTSPYVGNSLRKFGRYFARLCYPKIK